MARLLKHNLILFAGALLLWAGCGSAMAAIVINSMTVNDSTSTTVQTGAQMTVELVVTLTNTDWRSTRLTTSPASSVDYCDNSIEITGNGTWLVTYYMPAPSAAGTFSLTVVANSRQDCPGNGQISTRTLANAIRTVAPAPALHHVRIQHDGSGLNCSPEVITLRACANAACSTQYAGNVTMSLGAAAGSWSANPVTFSGGQTTVTLARSSGGTAVFSGTVTAPAAGTSSAVCYQNGVAGDCDMPFGEASCQLDAVEAGQAPNTPIFTRRVNAPVTVDVLTLLNGAITSGRAGDVSATIVDASSGSCSTSALSNTMTAPYASANGGRRSFSLTPTAASANARIRLVSGSLIQCSSDNFAVRPASFGVTTPDALADTLGANVAATPVFKAGSSPFRLAAASFPGYTGTPLIAAMRLAAADVNTGVNGVRGTLAGGFGAASGGTATASGLTYSEAGYFKILPYGVYDNGSFALVDASKNECFSDAALGTAGAIADPNVVNASGRIGCYFGNTETAYFGRFVPDRFSVGAGATLINRSASPSCSGAGFTYADEMMKARVPLLAQNAAGDTTLNYTGRFNRFAAGTQLNLGAINDAPVPGVRTPFPQCGVPAAPPCTLAGVITGSFVQGAATVEAALTVPRAATAVGPYEFFRVAIAPVDADGVRLGAYDIDTFNVSAGAPNRKEIGSTRIRYGRLQIDNAYGSELLNLSMRLNAQYWTGNGYATNTLDSCLAGGFSMTAHTGAITSANMNMTHLSAGSGLANGVGRLVLSKPTPAPAAKGSVVVGSSSAALPGKGRATFGLYKAGPVIYLRETY